MNEAAASINPNRRAASGLTAPGGIERTDVRFIRASMSRSMQQFTALAAPAPSAPPTIVNRMVCHGGIPPAAISMAANVVANSNTMMRGLVRFRYAVKVERAARPSDRDPVDSTGRLVDS